jgi:hypothetical protein
MYFAYGPAPDIRKGSDPNREEAHWWRCRAVAMAAEGSIGLIQQSIGEDCSGTPTNLVNGRHVGYDQSVRHRDQMRLQ